MTANILYFCSTDYARRTGGWVYNSHLISALRQQGAEISKVEIETAFPDIPRETLSALLPRLPSEGAGKVLVTDHIHVCQLLPLLRSVGLPVVPVFHHSLVVEHGNAEDPVGIRLSKLEQEALGFSDGIIATSDESKRYLLAHYHINPDRIRVAVPGNERAERARPPTDGPFEILSVGAVIPRKRYDYIVEIARHLGSRNFRWRIAGDPERYPELVEDLRERLETQGLADRVTLIGDVSDRELERLRHSASLFVAASRYEGYGMAVAEALRCGIPVVTTDSGAVTSWARDGVIGAPADDAAAVAGIIDRLLGEPERLAAEADRSWRFGQSLASWEETFAGIRDWIGELAPVTERRG